MAVTSVNITSTATLIHTTTTVTLVGNGPVEEVAIFNNGGTIVFIGQSAVTASTGVPLGPNSVLHLRDIPGVSIYGITAASTITGTIGFAAVIS